MLDGHNRSLPSANKSVLSQVFTGDVDGGSKFGGREKEV